jgi:hypothetical protein
MLALTDSHHNAGAPEASSSLASSGKIAVKVGDAGRCP